MTFYNFLKKINLTTISNVEKIFFLQNLRTMIRAGFSLDKSFGTLIKQTKNKEFKYIISQLKKDIEEGKPLHKALKKHSHVFSELFINLIEAGEISGNLENAIKHLLTQMKKNYALKKKSATL